MISIFLFYNTNRLSQLKKCISCLEELTLYNECQKILCVDGVSNYHPKNFDICEITRPKSGLYNWSKAWETGVSASKHETLLYLDGDRILPKNYLELILDSIQKDTFLYSKNLFYVDDIETEELKLICEKCQTSNNSKIELDERLPYPPNLNTLKIGKNCMSGNTAFKKSTYIKSGGVDPWYEGYGAADKDYYIQTYKMGFKHKKLIANELHIKHEKLNPNTKIMTLFNNIYCAEKWRMQLDEQILKEIKENKIDLNVVKQYKTLAKFLNASNIKLM